MKSVTQQAKEKGNKSIVVLPEYSTSDDIIDALDDLSTQHTEDSFKPKKLGKRARKKAILQKIAETQADIRMKAMQKFFE